MKIDGTELIYQGEARFDEDAVFELSDTIMRKRKGQTRFIRRQTFVSVLVSSPTVPPQLSRQVIVRCSFYESKLRPSNAIEIGSGIEESEASLSNTSFCHPSRLSYTLVVLFFVCFLNFGSYFAYDNPSALQKQILTDMDVSLSDFTLLYSLYSWPNVILSVIGGFLVDVVFGIELGSIVFTLSVVIGECVVALGAFVNQYWLMLLGRFIFALGGENVMICQSLYTTLWFKDSMLNMVFGLQLSVARLASSTNMWTMVPIYDKVRANSSNQPGYVGLGIAFFIGTIICLFSFVCAVILMFVDRHGKKVLKRKDPQVNKKTCADFTALVDVRSFPIQMWLLCAIFGTYYATVFPFVAIAQTFYVQKYSLSVGTANTVNSLVFLISLFASPVLGFLLDRTGRNIFWIMLGCLLTITAHVLIAFTLVDPFFCTSLLGIAFSVIASSLWPLVAYVVEKERLGTAYGIMQAIQNTCLAIIALISGAIVDAKGYLVLEIVFLLFLFVAITCTLVLWIVDGSRTGQLNMSTNERNQTSKSKTD